MVSLRQLRAIALLLALAVTAAACSSSSPSSGGGGGGKRVLKLHNDKGAWSEFFKEVGKLSEERIGIRMEPVGYTDAPTYEAFIKASFRTNVKPDLFTWHTGGRLQEVVETGRLAETSQLWQRAVEQGYLSKDLEPYYTVDGKQYCVPLNVAYWVMFYNKKVFDQHNLEPPETWDELLRIADILKQAGVTPFYHTSVLFSFVWFNLLMAGTDPDLYDQLAAGKVAWTDPRVVEVVELWKSLIDKGYMSNPGDTEDPAVQLASGKVAMAPFGTWFNTSMTQQKLKPGTDYGFFIIPNANPDLGKTSLIFETGPLCSLAAPPDRDASMRFLEWWLGPEAQEKWATSRGDVSANPKVTIPDPDLNQLNQDAGSGEYRLVNRLFEAVPPPVLTAALDGFGAFTTKPGDYLKILGQIDKAAKDYYSKQG